MKAIFILLLFHFLSNTEENQDLIFIVDSLKRLKYRLKQL